MYVQRNLKEQKTWKKYFFFLLKIYNKILFVVTLLIINSLYPEIHSFHAYFFCSSHALVTITLSSSVIATFVYS